MKNFKPMLARVYNQTPIDFGQNVYQQPKLDGVRCIFTEDGAFSRTGKRFMNVRHIERPLDYIWKHMPGLILDGELYNHDLRGNFEKLISLVRKQTPTHEDRLEAYNLIQFHVYDMAFEHWWHYGCDHMNWRYKKRMKWLNKQFDHYNEDWEGPINGENGRIIQVTKTVNCVTPAMIKVMHEFFLDQGYEGSIIRLNGEYEQKRSKNLLKVKDFQDSEAKIIGFVEGKGKRKGTIGKFIGRDSEGMEFGMPVMDNFKFLQKNFNLMKKWVGKTATFKYFEKTRRGSYRHPLFKCLRNYE